MNVTSTISFVNHLKVVKFNKLNKLRAIQSKHLVELSVLENTLTNKNM